MDKRNFSRPLDLKLVTVTDAFWHREQELVRKEVLPYQWEALNDRILTRRQATVCIIFVPQGA